MSPARPLFFSALLAAHLLPAPHSHAQSAATAPAVTLGQARVERSGNSTTVRLQTSSRLDWPQFSVGANETLRFLSEQSATGGRHASLNIVRSGLQAGIHGTIQADGPFYLISPGGIDVGPAARIQAPRLFLSTLTPKDESALLAGKSTAFTNEGARNLGVHGQLRAEGGLITLMAPNVAVSGQASAPGGQVQIIAASRGVVEGPDASGRFTAAAQGGQGQALNEGRLQARRVEILSDGFIRNGGRIETSGQGNAVRLSAPFITHEAKPNQASYIATSTLETEGVIRLEGPVIGPVDGANPAPVGGVRQTPRLSGQGFLTTATGSSPQLSHALVPAARASASPIPPPPRAATLASRRGPDAEPASKKQPAAAQKKKPRKASFFGQTFSR